MIKIKRILHVIHCMGRGGIETWLMNVLRNMDLREFKMDFLVFTMEQCAYDEEIEALGSTIFRCDPPSRGFQHLVELRKILTNEGPFNVVHAHGTEKVGMSLMFANQADIPIRIAHGHSANLKRKKSLRSHLFSPISRQIMLRHMTHGLGCSEMACEELFGNNWRSDSRCKPVYYGFDWEPFKNPADTVALKRELGLPKNAFVVGHVGRMVRPKNHVFWAKVAKCILQKRSDAHFLLVGNGELRPEIEGIFAAYGLSTQTVFAGERSDIPELMQAMDVFLFPSLYEGLGIVVVEAQAVGLPCVVSDMVPREAIVTDSHVIRMSLNEPPDAWAEQVISCANQPRIDNHMLAWNSVQESRFSLRKTIEILSGIYSSENI